MRIFTEIKDKPSLTVEATDLLKEISSGKSVFEFGSGGSTLWFSRFVKHLVSIEDSVVWYDNVSAVLKVEGCPNVDYRFAETAVLPDAISNEGLYDVVFVDCMTQNERRRSIILGAEHVKPGGWLVADDYGFAAVKAAVKGLRAAGWHVKIVTGTKIHPIKNVPITTSTAFCNFDI